jgi:transposase
MMICLAKGEDFTQRYRNRNDIETMFRDLKHGIDWRPARCTSEDAVRGRIMIAFLALFCMSMIRFLYPEFRSKTAESIV